MYYFLYILCINEEEDEKMNNILCIDEKEDAKMNEEVFFKAVHLKDLMNHTS